MTSKGTTLGVIFMIAFALTAPVLDAFAKLVPAEIAVGLVVAARFSIQAILLLPVCAAKGWLHRPSTPEMLLHVTRGALILSATGLFFTALRSMPIADAIAIFFVEPLVLTLLGGLILKEPVGPRRIAACLVGFAGALLVIQPSFAKFGLVATLPLGTALLFAFYMLLTRRMATQMHPVSLQAYTGLAAALLMLPILTVMNDSSVSYLDPSWPSQYAAWMMLGVGFAATISHLFISFALSLAPAATIAPLQYLEIISATALGYLIFGDFPNALTFTGIAIIVASGLYIFLRERSLERAET